jgi:glycosyltransferase involved in cell wall biosynthesis
MSLKIGILGTRGIPNRYGGFEQLAQHLAVGLVQKGHTVTVYNVHDHPYEQPQYQGVQLVHCRQMDWLGPAGQFVYDRNCLRDARKRGFDVVLLLGYTSSSIWHRLYPKAAVVSNMDGLEWQRSKYAAPVRWFLRHAEKWAVQHSGFLIADSPAIQQYLSNKYGATSQYIAYGATVFTGEDKHLLQQHGLLPQSYCMLMARMEPENNIAMVLQGFLASGCTQKLVVVGNVQNRHGRFLVKHFGQDDRILFIGPVYEALPLHTLKHNALLYFHGHSAGGTNPSLLEAMASRVPVAAHDNVFNRAVLQNDGLYFRSAADVAALLQGLPKQDVLTEMVQRNIEKVQQQYNWPLIIDQYEQFLTQCHRQYTT